jgi:hypothetical protein
MKIVSEFTYEKKALPSGKLTARWISSRCTTQVYLSGRYLTGVDGETDEECYRELHAHYDCDPDTRIAFQ